MRPLLAGLALSAPAASRTVLISEWILALLGAAAGLVLLWLIVVLFRSVSGRT